MDESLSSRSDRSRRILTSSFASLLRSATLGVRRESHVQRYRNFVPIRWRPQQCQSSFLPHCLHGRRSSKRKYANSGSVVSTSTSFRRKISTSTSIFESYHSSRRRSSSQTTTTLLDPPTRSCNSSCRSSSTEAFDVERRIRKLLAFDCN